MEYKVQGILHLVFDSGDTHLQMNFPNFARR